VLSIFDKFLPHLKYGILDECDTKFTMYNPNGIVQFTCGAIDFHSNKFFLSMLGAGGAFFSLICTKFDALVADVILKAECI